MSDEIRDYLDDLDNARDRWFRHTVLPYATAYERAYDSFQRTLDRQKAREKLMAELALIGLTVASGSVLTMVAGTALLKKALVDRAVSVVCEREMTRVFNALAMAADSKVISFALGAAWDGGVRLARKETSAQAARVLGGLSHAPSNELALPGGARAKLEGFIFDIKILAHDTMARLRDDPSVPDAEKALAVAQARQALLFQQPPALDVGRMARDIELGFYLSIIMNADKLQTVHYRPSMKTEGMVRSVVSSSRIPQRTSSPSYPDPSNAPIQTDRWGGFTAKEIGYDNIGHALKRRVNQLAGQEVFDTFGPFSEHLGHEHVQAAERLLVTTARRNARTAAQI